MALALGPDRLYPPPAPHAGPLHPFTTLEKPMPKTIRNPWINLGLDAWKLGFEASQVIAMRTGRIAMGCDPQGHETRLMVAEKIAATLELQAAMMTGSLGTTPAGTAHKVLAHYRKKVRANQRRLSS